jgi:hypothetical protein
MNNKTLAIVLAIVAVGVLGFAGFKMFGPGPKFPVEVKCEKCQAVGSVEACAATKYPIACPKCKEVAANPGNYYKCTNPACELSKKDTFMTDKEVVKGKEGIECPKCKQSMDLGTAPAAK